MKRDWATSHGDGCGWTPDGSGDCTCGLAWWLRIRDAELRNAGRIDMLERLGDPAMAEAFRQAWLDADGRGETGGRVSAGLAAVRALMVHDMIDDIVRESLA